MIRLGSTSLEGSNACVRIPSPSSTNTRLRLFSLLPINKVSGNCLRSISAAANDDSSSRVRIFLQFFVQCYHFHADVLLSKFTWVYYRSHQIFINSVNVGCMYKKTPGKPLFQAAQAVDTMILLHSLWVFPRSASHAVLFLYYNIFFRYFKMGNLFLLCTIFL